MLAILVIIAVAMPLVGGTFATWSDSEIMMDNYLKTGSIDLLVARCDTDWQNPGPFLEDTPWGTGLESCFSIPKIELDKTYPCYLVLWNAGCNDSVAYLHIKTQADSSLAARTTMCIWYDVDGDPSTPVELVESGTIANLDCNEIRLGLLETDQRRPMLLELIITGPIPANSSLSFLTIFETVQRELVGPRYAWADTECSSNALNMLVDVGGSPGFWNGKSALNQYEKSDIVSWFKAIVIASAWYENDLTMGSDDEVYDRMVDILKPGGAKDYEGMVNKLRSQYLAINLNTKTIPPRLQLGIIHDISGIDGAKDYFGYESGTLAQIISTIEGNASGDIFSEPPSKDELEIIKEVCDKLNNP
jgi:hypothetical protein